MNKAATTARAYEEMHDQREKIRAAIRLIEAGKSFNEAEIHENSITGQKTV